MQGFQSAPVQALVRGPSLHGSDRAEAHARVAAVTIAANVTLGELLTGGNQGLLVETLDFGAKAEVRSGDGGIVKTRGQKITKLKPVGGFCAETARALTLSGTAVAGIPVSTTHMITGAIGGVRAVHRLSAVRWGVAGRMIWAWIFTIPASALIAGATYVVINELF